jgi:cell wall-associated NlpC family hydrolase
VLALLAGALVLQASPSSARVSDGDADSSRPAPTVGAASAGTNPTSFKDVPSGYWANSAIKTVAVSNGWMRDFGSDTFKPETKESRKLFARTLIRVFHPDQKVDGSLKFSDLPSDDPFYAPANVAVKLGWMAATDKQFRPGDPVTMRAVHRALVMALGLGDEAAGIGRIHTADNYTFKHPRGLGTLMAGLVLGLRYNHGDESMDVGPGDALPRSEVAWSVARAYAVNTTETWRKSELSPYANIHLGAVPVGFRKVVEFGLRYVGYPYVYAGEWNKESPPGYCCGYQPRGGFDCSGFTWWLLAAPTVAWDNTAVRPYHGWPLPQRSSNDMAKAIPQSQRIPFSKLTPGDLMFYDGNRDGTIDHVDTYLGWGWAFDSSSYLGGVSIIRISGGWYRDHFVWGRDIMRPAS